ncbi:MAG TPA: DASS family sodium-coupled anion symporter [Candidatus Dormibacteraeota bacterium]|nr:DASS family sodium-coupled anion symporter [Candidatus Dormibacteraeota bacterium]
MEEGGGASLTSRQRAAVLTVAGGLAAAVYAWPLPGIPESGRRMTSILLVVVTLWLSEALPISVTALLGPALAVLVGAASATQAFSAFGNPILMLFIGSFLLAGVTFKFRLNERIAYRVLSIPAIGSDPTRAFVVLALTTAALSAWMSNVAVTAMMLPIAESVLVAISGEGQAPPRMLAAAFVLIVTYAASVGGLFTPVGTPPNLIGIGLIQQATGHRIAFGEWVVEVFPVTFIVLVTMTLYLVWLFREDTAALTYDRRQMAARYAALGPWRSVERRVLVALLITALLWITPSILSLFAPAASEALTAHLPESVVPVLVAGVLFWLPQGDGVRRPVLDLGDLGGIDWPVVVLFGGGMCLGQLMMDTGVAAALGKLLASFVPAGHSPQLVFMFCLLAIAVSETTSNTASANMVVPVVIAVSAQAGADPVRLGLAATVACTFGFMLPVSTPTNAMAYSTGFVTQRQMIRYGILLDVIGAAALTFWFGYVVP